MNTQRMVSCIAVLTVAVGGLGLWATRDQPAVVETQGGGSASAADAAPPPSTTTTWPVAKQEPDGIPGRGVVDVPLGEMVPTDPPDFSRQGLTPGEAVKVAGPSERKGLVEWSDFAVDFMPADQRVPYPMVPIRDEAGAQIAWWAKGMGWVDFETVAAPDFDYAKVYAEFLDDSMPSCGELEELDVSIAC